MSVVKIIRQLFQEVRRATPDEKLKNSIIKPYITEQYRKFVVTDAQLCKKKHEMIFLADSYRCYLQSTRQYKELVQKYHGKGERSVKETADMVGFKLPHDSK